MAYDPNSLTPDDYVFYRLTRYGEAGRFGEKGMKNAGRRHGVGARAWAYYESGHRQPSLTQRKVIAGWLNRHTRRAETAAATTEPNA